MFIKNYGDMKIGNFQRYLISYILILLRFFLDLQGFSGFGFSATTPFLRHFRIEFYVRKPF